MLGRQQLTYGRMYTMTLIIDRLRELQGEAGPTP